MSRILSLCLRAGLAASLLLIACGRPQTSDPGKPLDSAKNAYFQFDLKQASRLFRQVWQDPHTSPEDRAEAGRTLARIAALFHQDHDQAVELIGELEAIEADQTLALLLLARIEAEGGNFEAAVAAANGAESYAQTRPEQLEAYTEFSRAVLAQAVDRILDNKVQDLDRRRLEEAFERIDEVLQEQRGKLTPSLVALQLALILGKGPKALEAWRSYFHVRPGTHISGVLEEPAKALESILSGWTGQALERAEKEQLTLALAGSRMYQAARVFTLIAMDQQARNRSDIAEVIAYHEYLESIDRITRDFYRKTANGAGADGAYLHDIHQQARILWPKLGWPDDTPKFSSQRFEQEISLRFGAQVTTKRINGFLGLHMGHRVADEAHRVEQYGESAALRFISLDFMVSNGYTSWFWDGRAQVGGWAANPTIIQIRSAYADQGINAWKEISDPQTRRKIELQIAEHEPGDLTLARHNPHAYLPGLARRIEYNSYQRLLDDLEAQGLEGAELRLAFIAEIERIDLESSIIAHEGRHAIDSRSIFNFMRRSATKEFRAKLSEVAFSSSPYLAIGGGILSQNIGDGSAHGEANERIMAGLVEWMEAHLDAVDGLDPALPLLPQLDRLSDEQLREAFRAMDPMAS